MRFIIFGAGAVGGCVGARLFESGHDVLLIARGAHGSAIADHGLTLRSPEGDTTFRVPVVSRPSDVDFRTGDAVFLGMKTQDTIAALDDLLAASDPSLPVVCAQNGVEGERVAARRFEHVYATPVRLPATHLEPGVVVADSAPITGVLDIGRYPSGSDAFCEEFSAALAASTFSSRPIPDVMRHKYTKLLVMNLGNAVEAVCGSGVRDPHLIAAARAEAVACYNAAGIDFASEEEDRTRRGNLITIRPIAGAQRGGGSTWQSLSRGKRELEVDYLNGEIVLLGRTHGVPTPVNATLQRVANHVAREGLPPGSVTLEALRGEAGLP